MQKFIFFLLFSSAVFAQINVGMGVQHTCAHYVDSGTVQCWGSNNLGQLNNANQAVVIDVLSGVPASAANGFVVAQLAVGYNHNCVLGSGDKGQIACWGHNGDGQLGRGNSVVVGCSGCTTELTPIAFKNVWDAAAGVTAGDSFTCAWFVTGVARCWGAGTFGKHGMAGGGVTTYADMTALPDLAFHTSLTGVPVVSMSAGKDHACSLFANGKIVCMGCGANGRLGYDSVASDDNTAVAAKAPIGFSSTDRAVAVSAGETHTCAVFDVTGGRRIRCWGSNAQGECGVSGGAGNVGDGTGPSMGTLGFIPLPAGVTSVAAVSTQSSSTCVMGSNAGQFFCFGLNTNGQLGRGNTSPYGGGANEMNNIANINFGAGPKFTFLGGTAGAAAAQHACAVFDVSMVKCWGNSAGYRLGNGNTAVSVGIAGTDMAALKPVMLSRSKPVVSAGASNGCALFKDKIRCWGLGLNGERASGDATSIGTAANQVSTATPIAFGGSSVPVAVSTGPFTSCALFAAGAVTCWGKASPALGRDTSVDNVGCGGTCLPIVPAINFFSEPNVRAIAVSVGGSVADLTSHACGLFTNGKVRCWGHGSKGQLGVTGALALGDGANPISTVQYITFKSSFNTQRIVSISCGGMFSCVVFSAAGVVCFGDNTGGVLGLGATTPNTASIAVSTLSTITFGQTDPATYVSAGQSHVCTLHASVQKIKCWGTAADGRLGTGTTSPNVGLAATDMTAIAYITFGTTDGATQVAAFAAHTCALFVNQRARCWGFGGNGRLGYDSTASTGVLPISGVGFITATNQPTKPMIAISTGSSATHTCVLMIDDSIACWGSNTNGQLARGDSLADWGGASTNMAAIVPLSFPPPSPVCGNGIMENPDTCDDRNTVSGDGCSSSCTVESADFVCDTVLQPSTCYRKFSVAFDVATLSVQEGRSAGVRVSRTQASGGATSNFPALAFPVAASGVASAGADYTGIANAAEWIIFRAGGLAAVNKNRAGLVLQMAFENAALTSDSSAYAHSLIYSVAPTYSSSGKFGGAAYFDGVSNLLSTTGSTAPTVFPSGASAYTFSMWIKPDVQDVVGLLGWGAAASNQRFKFEIASGGNLCVQWEAGTALCAPFGVAQASYSTNWVHVGTTFDGTSTRALYIGGQRVATDTATGLNLATANFYLPRTDTAQYRGYMDDLRIYSRALSPREMYQLFNPSDVVIETISDGVTEVGGETVVLTITNTDLGPYNAGASSSSTITILDEPINVAFASATYAVTEGGNSGTTALVVSVQRTGRGSTAASVTLTFSGTAVDAIHYNAPSTLLSLGTSPGTYTVTLAIVGDTVNRGVNTVVIGMTTPTPADTVISGITSTTVTITDDDAGSNDITLGFSGATYQFTEGTSADAVITINRGGTGTGTCSVPLSYAGTAIGGTHYSQVATVSCGTGAGGSFTVTLPLFNDGFPSTPDRNIIVTLGAATLTSPAGVVALTAPTTTITILDDDIALDFEFAAVTVTEGPSVTAQVKVARTGSSTQPCTVPIAYSGTAVSGVNYAAGASTLSCGSTAGLYTYTFGLIEDTTDRGPTTVILTLGTATFTGGTASSPSRPQTTITINDNDGASGAPVIGFNQASYMFTENMAPSAQITIMRGGTATGPCTVSIAFSGTAVSGVQYTAPAGPVSCGSGPGSFTFPIGVPNNNVNDGPRTVVMSLGAPSIGSLGPNPTATLSIADDDVPADTVSTLNSLFVGGGGGGSFPLTPAFTPNNLFYTTTAPSTLTAVVFTVAAASNLATIRVGATVHTSTIPGPPMPLAGARTDFLIVVTPQSATAPSTTYTISVFTSSTTTTSTTTTSGTGTTTTTSTTTSGGLPPPPPASCPADRPITCWDGSCQLSFAQCPCPMANPFKCPSGLCAPSSASCSASCPVGQTLCWNSMCKTDFSQCDCPPTQPFRCPLDNRCVVAEANCATAGAQTCSGATPLLCWDGACVSDLSRCSCPPQKPFKCADGRCATALADCTATCPAAAAIKCWDNSCVADPVFCPCQSDRPVRCRDGAGLPLPRCVALQAECTATTTCPAATPVNCWNGVCVASPAQCSCAPETPIRCSSDSRCVSAQSMCPVFTTTCEIESPALCGPASGNKCVRCPSDNSCRRSTAECPGAAQVSVCPANAIQCPGTGQCASSFTNCPATSAACPGFTCPTGECVPDRSRCPATITCPDALKPMLCPDGKCVANPAECSALRTCPAASPFLCPDQSCVRTSADCPRGIVCPAGLSLCADRTCKASCSAVVDCPQARCADGSCAPSADRCPTRPTCTGSLVSCPDGSCRQICPVTEIASCPTAAPIRCPSSGLCVTAFALCPQNPACPPSASVLCPDKVTCAATAAQCPSFTPCRPSEVTCSNGSCAPRLQDCPTPKICPDAAPVLCSDRSCAASVEKCPDPSLLLCPADRPFRCASGGCAPHPSLCAPGSVCAGSLPVKCWDNSCAKTAADCPALVQRCPAGQVECESGGCANSLAACPSPTTCPARCSTVNLGFKCASDNSCQASGLLCPASQRCASSQPVKCPGATCAASYAECPTAVTCPASRPAKCWDSTCRASPCDCPLPRRCSAASPTPFHCASTNQCVSTLTDLSICPASTTRCADPALPVLCESGKCVADVSNCPAELAECPAPKVWCNGACVVGPCAANTGSTPGGGEGAVNPFESECPARSPFACGGGVCAAKEADCPALPAGACSADLSKPFLCPDRFTCAKNRADCTGLRSSCPPSRPFRCPGGLCATSMSVCIPPDEVQGPCPTGSVRCADGSCAPGMLMCMLLAPCPVGSSRCGDATCRASCAGVASTCPTTLPTRCDDGSCASAKDLCPLANGCPSRTPTRCAGGRCAADAAACAAQPALGLGSGCPNPALPYRCPSGQCATSSDGCRDRSTGCAPPAIIRCPNGDCAESVSSCPASTDCPAERPVRCPNRSCAATLDQCEAVTGCPLSARFLCADGTCVKEPSQCKPAVVCGDDTPVRCADGSCAISEARCRPLVDCPAGRVRCPSSSACAPSLDKCPSGCPPSSPFQCPASGVSLAGRCVSTPSDCLTGSEQCDPSTPFLCAGGSCASSPSACPKITCKTGEVQCADGSCAATLPLCPAIIACPATAPARCNDGSCAASLEACPSVAACPAAKPSRCSDGTCAEQPDRCPAVNGCPSGTVSCPTGLCKASIAECRGACKAEEGFPCGENNSCTTDTTLCIKPDRLRKALPLAATLDCAKDMVLPIYSGSGSTRLGRVEIPGGTLSCDFSTASIGPISDSSLSTIAVPGDSANRTTPLREQGLLSGAFSAELPPAMLASLKGSGKAVRVCLDMSNAPAGALASLGASCVGYVNDRNEWQCQCPNPELQADGVTVCCSTDHLSTWSSTTRCNGKLDTCGVCNGDDSTCKKYDVVISTLSAEDFKRLACLGKVIMGEKPDCAKQAAAFYLVLGLFVAYLVLLYPAIVADRRHRERVEKAMGRYFADRSDDKVRTMTSLHDSTGEKGHKKEDVGVRPEDPIRRLIYDRVCPPSQAVHRTGIMRYLHKVKELFLDEHSWMSVAFVHATSKVLRVHRLTLLLLAVLFSFAANAIFYRPGDLNQLQSLIQGLVSALVEAPVVGVATLLFLSAAPRKNSWWDRAERAFKAYEADVVNRLEAINKARVEQSKLGLTFVSAFNDDDNGNGNSRFDDTVPLRQPASVSGLVRSTSYEVFDEPEPAKKPPKQEEQRKPEPAREQIQPALITLVKPSKRINFWRMRSILPWHVRYVAWTYLFLMSLLTAVIVCAYGVTFDSDTQTNWLVSSSFGVFCDVFIVDPLKIILHAAITVLFAGLFDQLFSSVSTFAGM